MSYLLEGNGLSFFSPSIAVATTTSGPLRNINLGASSASNGEFICNKACKMKRLQFVVSETAVVGTTTAPTVVFSRRPTPGSATGAVVVGTLTIPNGTALGKVLYKDVSPVSFAVGDAIEIAWTIAVGSPAGAGQASFVCEENPEVPANNADMVLSA